MAAVEEGRCTPGDAERLVGYLASQGRWSHAPSTARRREAQLRELNVPPASSWDRQTMEIAAMFHRGEITADEAEIRVGRLVMADLAVRAVGALSPPPGLGKGAALAP